MSQQAHWWLNGRNEVPHHIHSGRYIIQRDTSSNSLGWVAYDQANNACQTAHTCLELVQWCEVERKRQKLASRVADYGRGPEANYGLSGLCGLTYQVTQANSTCVSVRIWEWHYNQSVCCGEITVSRVSWPALKAFLDQKEVPVPLEQVKSTVFTRIGYDPNTKRLELEFQSGSRHVIENFPHDLYKRFRKSKSLGRFYNKNIKGVKFE